MKLLQRCEFVYLLQTLLFLSFVRPLRKTGNPVFLERHEAPVSQPPAHEGKAIE